jgi:hypothetical protein
VLALSNTAATAVDATVRFLTTAGQRSRSRHGAGLRHATVDVGTVPGLETAGSRRRRVGAAATVDLLTWDVSRYGSHTGSLRRRR